MRSERYWFRVLDDGPTVCAGAIVEGSGRYVYAATGFEDPLYLGIYFGDADLHPAALARLTPDYRRQREALGCWFTGIRARGLEPLTPEATEMLRLVTP